MNYKHLLTLTAVTLLMSGCVTGKHAYSESGECLTCINNPVTGEALNYKPEESNQDVAAKQEDDKGFSLIEWTEAEDRTVYGGRKETGNHCGERIKYESELAMDVDLAYLEYKRKFHYFTVAEKRRQLGLAPDDSSLYGRMNNGYKHDVTPGLLYDLQDTIIMDGMEYFGWLHLTLEKSGVNKTRAYVSYCIGGNEGFTAETAKKIDAALYR